MKRQLTIYKTGNLKQVLHMDAMLKPKVRR